MKKIVCFVLLFGMLLTLCSCAAEEGQKIEEIQIIEDYEYSTLRQEVNNWLWNNRHVEIIEIEFEIMVFGGYNNSVRYVAMIHYMK
jgi:hypothetical protein